MKFQGSIKINQSREKVVQLFSDNQKLKDWQEGLQSKKLISGEEGQKGAISMMYYENGKHKMELRETILKNNLPLTFEAFYHHKHMDNTMKCWFTEIEDGKTLYKTEVEYTRINWIMPKLMAILFPSMYRKQAQKWMDNFKALAERQ